MTLWQPPDPGAVLEGVEPNEMVWDPKDPWSRGGDPLEDAIRQAKERFQRLGPPRGMRPVVTVLVLAFLIWQSTFIVGPDEEGVVRRFGAVVRNVGPGPHLKLPFIETVQHPKVTTVHRIQVGFRTDFQGRQQMLPREALMLTGDGNIVAVEFIVQYKIQDAIEFLFNVDEVEETIQKAAEAAMREIIGKSQIDEALTTGKALIQSDTQVLLQRILDDYQAGVSIQRVQLQDVNPPEAVAAAFKDVQSAKEDKEKLINQSESYRNDIIPKAKGEAAQIVNQARGYAQARLNRAQGEANRFLQTLKEYRLAKDVISKRVYIETMEAIFAGMDKVIVDGKVGERVLPYLPLDRLGKRSGRTADGEAKASQP